VVEAPGAGDSATVVKLTRWSVVYQDGHVYRPPESRRLGLHGIVEGHESHPDGTPVTTSAIDSADSKKRTVTTSSGRVYQLEGPPDPHYAKWVAEHRHLAGTGELAKLVEKALKPRKGKKKATG
jgi:hypothetical protein